MRYLADELRNRVESYKTTSTVSQARKWEDKFDSILKEKLESIKQLADCGNTTCHLAMISDCGILSTHTRESFEKVIKHYAKTYYGLDVTLGTNMVNISWANP